ncbi:uncharacterized protein LOC142220532 [Haematobia irritans]|uniref:uncharacterized protein LOC142220532 n=1 Tax=Haematobia irritans TaxID=7368 RepID=UPI003F506669
MINTSVTSTLGRGKRILIDNDDNFGSSISVNTTSQESSIESTFRPGQICNTVSNSQSQSCIRQNISEDHYSNCDPYSSADHCVSPSGSSSQTSQMESGNQNLGDPPPLAANPHMNANTIESLMAYIQQALAASRLEIAQEMRSLRDSISQPVQNAGSGPPSPSNSNQLQNFVLNSPRINLKDWNVTFNGEGNVSDFIFKIDVLTQRTQCPLDYLLNNFQIFLTGKAETWYWLYMRQYPQTTYSQLKSALTSEFGNLENDNEIRIRISTRKQHLKETYDDFHSIIIQMNSRLRNPMDDASLIEIIKKNVLPELKVMLVIVNPKSLGELRDLARTFEKVVRENKTHSHRTRQVDELSVDNGDDLEDDFDPQVDAIRVARSHVKGDYSRIKCWNCLQMGHSYIYCPDETRRVFCYKCGRKDVTTPKCDHQLSENGRKSELLTGDTRSPK